MTPKGSDSLDEQSSFRRSRRGDANSGNISPRLRANLAPAVATRRAGSPTAYDSSPASELARVSPGIRWICYTELAQKPRKNMTYHGQASAIAAAHGGTC